MFFEDLKEIKNISEKTNFAIFVLKDLSNLEKIYQVFPKNTLFLKPDEKTKKILIEQVRVFTSLSNSKEKKQRFFIVENAEKMNEAAQNAFLKNLEEPKDNNHYLLLVKNLSMLLPTIRSRANIYIQKIDNPLEKPIEVDEKIKKLAKELITARPADLLKISTEISGKKTNSRDFALSVIGTAIEILYKSFFKTKNEKFLKKLPNLLELYSNIENNGHIKLHFVADML